MERPHALPAPAPAAGADLHALDLHHDGVPEAIAAHALELGGGAFALVDPGPGATLEED